MKSLRCISSSECTLVPRAVQSQAYIGAQSAHKGTLCLQLRAIDTLA